MQIINKNEDIRVRVATQKKQKCILDFSQIPESIPIEVAEAFAEHRKILKKPLTQYALRINLEKAATAQEFGLTPQQVVEETIAAGWLGIEPEWVANRKKSSQRANSKQIDMKDTGWFDSIGSGFGSSALCTH
jgi:plasmid stability protein